MARGAEAAARLLRQHPDVTGLCVGTPVQAIGALRAIADAGIEVTATSRSCARTTLQMAEYLRPPLTLIRVPLAEVGRRPSTPSSSRLFGEPAADVTVAEAPVIVEGESVAWTV